VSAVLAVPNCLYATSASFRRLGMHGHGDDFNGRIMRPSDLLP
jgi:hypothetical protein